MVTWGEEFTLLQNASIGGNKPQYKYHHFIKSKGIATLTVNLRLNKHGLLLMIRGPGSMCHLFARVRITAHINIRGKN